MTIDYLHICDWAGSLADGKPCVFGAFEAITVSELPCLYPAFAVAIFLRGQPHARATVRVDLTDPRGQSMGHLDTTDALPASGVGFIHHAFVGTTFHHEGRYFINVTVEGRPVAAYPLAVSKAPE